MPVDTAIRLSRDSTWTIASMADFGDQISLVETFEGRAEWLQRNFPESGESKKIVKDFNTKVLSAPETIIQGLILNYVISLKNLRLDLGGQTSPCREINILVKFFLQAN